MTQLALSKEMEISKSHLSELESGKKQPNLEMLQRYSKALSMPVSSIIYLAEVMEGIEPALPDERVVAIINLWKLTQK